MVDKCCMAPLCHGPLNNRRFLENRVYHEKNLYAVLKTSFKKDTFKQYTLIGSGMMMTMMTMMMMRMMMMMMIKIVMKLQHDYNYDADGDGDE